MATARRRQARSLLIAPVLALIVIVLGMLQHRWIGELAEAHRERLQSGVASSAEHFQELFLRELITVGMSFRRERIDIEGTRRITDARRFESWREFTSSPGLVSSIYIAEAEGDGLRFLRYEESTGKYEPDSSAERFVPMLEKCPGMEDREGSRRGGPPSFWPWIFDEGTPTLVYPIPAFRPGSSLRAPSERPSFGFLIVELDREYIREEWLPRLVRIAFGSAHPEDYRIGVIQEPSGDLLFGSDPSLTSASFDYADRDTDLFGGPDPGSERARRQELEGRLDPFRRAGQPTTRCPTGSTWRLVVRRQEGSVERAVDVLRSRNLAISGGVLVLLSVTMVMLVASTQRAQRLAKAQMDFAVGVSHELRTPLAVIRSASDNLAEGVVIAPDRVKEYGALIRSEGRRLSTMVEQTLDFASTEAGQRHYELKPASVTELIELAVKEVEPMIDEASFVVEKDLAAGLPLVEVDATALIHCVQNLITNALKYAAAGRWIGLSAVAAVDGKAAEVRISVADRGPGIAPHERDHIFEAFYQGRSDGEAKSRGVGLGLSLTRSEMEAMGGRVSVESSPGEGSRFTLHIPVKQEGGNN